MNFAYPDEIRCWQGCYTKIQNCLDCNIFTFHSLFGKLQAYFHYLNVISLLDKEFWSQTLNY